MVDVREVLKSIAEAERRFAVIKRNTLHLRKEVEACLA
jgi:hypothetical protein